MKIACKTLFDCSVTGITGHFKPSQLPFQDRSGQLVTNQFEWNRSRNQQRNWETLLQIIGLRTQPTVIQAPTLFDGSWCFEFETASDGVYSSSNNVSDLTLLYQDCRDVPMIVNLNNETQLIPMLCVSGANQNIWFEAVNTSLENKNE